MPTYEYVCKNCGENFDIHQSFSDKPLKKHSTCGGELQKVFHARGIVFKGGGFYATDSKSSGSANSSPKSGDDVTKDTSPKETSKKSEKSSKATKTEAKTSSSTSDDS